MTLKEFFRDRDVLEGDEALAFVVLGNRVDERRRIPVAEPVEENGDVDQPSSRYCFGAVAGLLVVASSRLMISFVRSRP